MDKSLEQGYSWTLPLRISPNKSRIISATYDRKDFANFEALYFLFPGRIDEPATVTRQVCRGEEGFDYLHECLASVITQVTGGDVSGQPEMWLRVDKISITPISRTVGYEVTFFCEQNQNFDITFYRGE